MKERILEFLKKLALDKFASPSEKEALLSSLCVDEKFVREKSDRIMDYLIKNYNFFQVQTIDSFINAILSGCAFKLNLSANFKTKENYMDYLIYSLDKLIDKANSDEVILNLFHDFLTRYLFIENKTGWFPKQNILSIISSLYSKSNRFAGSFSRSSIEAKDLILRKKAILKLMNKLRENLPGGTNAAFSKNLSDFLDENEDGFDIDEISIFFKREDFPVNKGNTVPPQIMNLWDRIRKGIGELCELESRSAFNYYVDIFNNVLGDLKSISSKDDVLFLEALNKEARSLFGDKDFSLPELYYRLATRLKHFLIDEFQDTSMLQWENLYIMIEEALSTGGSLFYVGDRKQAIYRFRGGEASLMDLARECFRNFNLIQGSLSKNYRSQKEIVEFNNTVFSESNLRRFIEQAKEKKSGMEFSHSDLDGIVNIYQSSRQAYREDKTDGYVKLEFVDCPDRVERDEFLKDKVLNIIKDLAKRFSLKDVAILTRKNDEVELLTSWLLEKNIPVESEKTLDIRENSYIKEIISFLKFLNSPIDNLSFASFILGEIFSGASGLDSRRVQDFIFSLNNRNKNNKNTAYLYREFRLQFPEIWDGLIEEFFKSVGFVPLYELVISILSKFNCLSNFYNYQGFFMRFLELIKEQEDEIPGISSFLKFFDEAKEDDLYVHVADSDSIKILTIHKSKGLGFPVVIIPFLEMNVKVDSGVVIPVDGSLKYMRIKKRYADFSYHLKEVYKIEYLKSFMDELNSIYVAFTRAEDELYVFHYPRAEGRFNLASLLLPENNLEIGSRIEYNRKEDDKRGSLTIDIPPSEYKDWLRLLRGGFIEEDILQNREKILKGEVLHSILSFIGNLHNKAQDLVVKEALEKARNQYPFIHDFKEFKLTINRLLDSEELKPYFEVEDGEIFLEKEIVDASGNTRRIDRLIIKIKEAIIIDYKGSNPKKDRPSPFHIREGSNEKEGLYYSQILEYMRIIQDIYPDSRIRGILIYLDDLSAEEVSGAWKG